MVSVNMPMLFKNKVLEIYKCTVLYSVTILVSLPLSSYEGIIGCFSIPIGEGLSIVNC